MSFPLWSLVCPGFGGTPSLRTGRSHPSAFFPQITAVCNFFTYIRYIQQGLVRQDGEHPLVASGGMVPQRDGTGSQRWDHPERVLLSLSQTRTLQRRRLWVSKGLVGLLVPRGATEGASLVLPYQEGQPLSPLYLGLTAVCPETSPCPAAFRDSSLLLAWHLRTCMRGLPWESPPLRV